MRKHGQRTKLKCFLLHAERKGTTWEHAFPGCRTLVLSCLHRSGSFFLSPLGLAIVLREGLQIFLVNQFEGYPDRPRPPPRARPAITWQPELSEDLCIQGPMSARASSSCTQTRHLRHPLVDLTSKNRTGPPGYTHPLEICSLLSCLGALPPPGILNFMIPMRGKGCQFRRDRAHQTCQLALTQCAHREFLGKKMNGPVGIQRKASCGSTQSQELC